uniref:Helicase n=1 Tax=viral metagenome TaxID=1070528 RepID=A0A6C0C8C7_9ZZZZ
MEKYLRQLRNINSMYPITKNMGKKEKGNLFELYTYHLFIHEPRLNNRLNKIWLYNDIPKNILTELNLPQSDRGIDLLAIINNKYYAIQCKFRQNPDATVPWSSLSTFFGLSFGVGNKIAGGFFVTNTRNLCQEVINSDKVIAIYDDFYDSLPDYFFKNILDNKVEYTYIQKNILQIESLTASRIHFLDNKRGYIEMACGIGKTLASYWIANSICLGKTVVFVPSLQLLSQFYSEWINQSYAEGRNLKYLLVGSDADVEDEIKEKSNGLMLQLDPLEIRKHLKDNVVVICTYQSADKLAQACNRKIKFDLGIFDEAHKTVGQKGKFFSRMLFDNGFTINKRLFMTATPKMYVGDNDDDIISMDNKKIYGEKIYAYNVGKAINEELLVDYQILSIYTTNKAIQQDIENNLLLKYANVFDEKEGKYIGTILVISKLIAEGVINHLLTYHSTIAKAEKFAKFFKIIHKLLYGSDIYVSSVDGNDTMKTRKNIIKEYNNSKAGILCSARVLNEGVNIPIVDSVCFVDPRVSTIDITQCIGRCLRLCKDKKMAHIVVPIFIDDINDEFDRNEFGTIIKILKAMKCTDSELIECFRSTDRRTNTGRKIICKKYYDTVNISKEFDIHMWEKEIIYKLWKSVDLWDHKYSQLKRYIEENRKIPSLGSEDVDDKSLATWCDNQRQKKKRGELSDELIKRLNDLGSCWYWELADFWYYKYDQLKQYIEENQKNPSVKSNVPSEVTLANWCTAQREKKKNGKLADDLIKKLDNLDYWHWNPSDKWNNRCADLIRYIKKYGRLPYCGSLDSTEKSLANWCSIQRSLKRKGDLSDVKVNALNNISEWFWDFDSSISQPWNQSYENVKKFIEDNDRLPDRPSKCQIEFKLANWCTKQRCIKRKGKLLDDRINQLNKLKYWIWDKPKISGSKTANPKKLNASKYN